MVIVRRVRLSPKCRAGPSQNFVFDAVSAMQINQEVDIVILSWNRVEDTIRAIHSAHGQVGLTKAIWIVDQGSDASNLVQLREFVDGIPEATLKELGKNVGVAGGRNEAIGMGRFPYVVALDSDAEFSSPDTVLLAVSYLKENPRICALGFRITNFFTMKNDYTSWDYPGRTDPLESFETSRFIGAGHAFRRQTFELVGGYDSRLFFCGEELDLCYRMLNTGKSIQYYPQAEILHKVSPEHRVFWGKGRFFYTMRNNLYTAYKFETPFFKLVLSVVAFAITGFRNRILKDVFPRLVGCTKDGRCL